MLEKLKKLSESMREELSLATSTDVMEKVWRAYLGSLGSIKLAVKEIKDLSSDEKKTVAPLMQELYKEALSVFQENFIVE